MSAVLGEHPDYLLVALYPRHDSKNDKEENIKIDSYAMALSRQHLLLSACLPCRLLLPGRREHSAVCCVRFCSGRLQAVLLCLRYLDAAVAIRAWFVPLLRCAQEKSRLKKKEKTEQRKKNNLRGTIRNKKNPRRQLRAERSLKGQRTTEGGHRRHQFFIESFVRKGWYSKTPQGGANLQRCVYKRPSQATVAECGRC